MDLEKELQRALERKMPSADFAERVIAAARTPRTAPRARFAWLTPRAWVAAAAAAALMLSAGVEYRAWRGRQAKQRVLLALRITSTRLNRIQNLAAKPSRRDPVEAPQ